MWELSFLQNIEHLFPITDTFHDVQYIGTSLSFPLPLPLSFSIHRLIHRFSASVQRERRSKVSALLMHLVYAASGLPTLCHNGGASTLQLHWIIRSPQRCRLPAAAIARRINGTLEYKLVERFEMVRFYPDVFPRRRGSSPYTLVTLVAKFPEKSIGVPPRHLYAAGTFNGLRGPMTPIGVSGVSLFHAINNGRHSAYIIPCITWAHSMASGYERGDREREKNAQNVYFIRLLYESSMINFQ